MSQLALPDDLARAAAQQVAMERQASAILQNLTFGVYCQLAGKILVAHETSCEAERLEALNWAADASQEAAIVMAERFGFHFSRRAPESPT